MSQVKEKQSVRPTDDGPVHFDPLVTAPAMPTPRERLAAGKAHRAKAHRKAHAVWQPPAHRTDPVTLLEQSSQSRLQPLVPIRYGRMMASPFAFLRGSPIVMTADLAGTPVSGIQVQVCGDAHLMNFGLYASPERNLLFDVNDFDETLPGPWEYDLKRLATSVVVAGRTHGLGRAASREAAAACACSYRERLREYSHMRQLEVWYSRVDAGTAVKVFRRSGAEGAPDLNKARRRNSLQALSKLAIPSGGRLRIVDNPPLVSHVMDPGLGEWLRRLLHGYHASLQDDRRHLLERYRLVDFALKVVGVGSIGTRCYILLLDASHTKDPLFLQIKEAQTSVLEPHVGKSRYKNHGQRVVNGQRLMQSASDIFLGWASEGGHDYYVRQLRDMKGTADLEQMGGSELIDYAVLCGWVLARAHARSGDAALISGYLGKSAVFDDALVAFAQAYADQAERDYDAFQMAVKAGRLPVEMGV
jgi:uncharacterized protein (DUF2252 family)